MTEWENATDDELEALVAAGVDALETPPLDVAAAARAAFDLHDLDASLARLIEEAAVVRATDDDRADASFETDDGRVTVSVERDRGAWHVRGTAPTGAAIAVRTTSGDRALVDVDEGGYFDHTVEADAGVVVRLEVGDPVAVVSPWMP